VADVEFWAVGGPWGDDTIERERRYARQSRMTLSLAFDGSRSAARAMHINGFPSVVLLDKSGHVRFVHSGYDASEPLVRELSERIDSLRKR
jgi:protein-disulfide isomerase-like protein with CxxC motif